MWLFLGVVDDLGVRLGAQRVGKTGTKRLRHPAVGEPELNDETLRLDADDGLRLALYTAEPGIDLPADARPPGQLDGDARADRDTPTRRDPLSRAADPGVRDSGHGRD